jgi:hypothetical protein
MSVTMNRRLPPRVLSLVCAALGLGSAGVARAQFLTPSTAVVVPPVLGTLLEVEVSWYRPEAFVDAYGSTQRFPGSLDLGLGVVRASYSPWEHVAFGVVVPYRWTRLGLGPGFPPVSASGTPGVGVFADWTSGPCAGHALCPTVRLGYYRARSDASPTVTISDGIRRAFVVIRVAPVPMSEADRWQVAGTLSGEYGWPVGVSPREVDSRLQLELGHVLGRVGRSDVWLFGLAGYRSATSATQDDMYFHDGTSRSGFAGARLDWRMDPEVPERRVVTLNVARDVRPTNALVGWRAGVSFVTTL